MNFTLDDQIQNLLENVKLDTLEVLKEKKRLKC